MSAKEKRKRSRAPNFSNEEVRLLLQLALQEKDILENKRTDSEAWKLKAETWQKISDNFNATSGLTFRSADTLRQKYDGMKKCLKKKVKINKAETMKTGGGKPQYIVIDGPEKELLEVLSFPNHGLPAVGDSDRNLPQTTITGEILNEVNPVAISAENTSLIAHMEIEPFNVDVRKNNNFTDRYYHAKKTGTVRGTVLEDIPAMVINYFGDPHMDWNYQTEPEPIACQGYPDKKCTWPRGRVLGGCSVINGMMYTRGTPKDYENWVKAGNPGWSYQDVLPVFKRFEDNKDIGSLVDAKYHGVNGPLTTSRFRHQPEMAFDILNAAHEIGQPVSNDLNGEQYTGFSIAQSNTRDGVRLSSARAYVRPQRNNPNFHVMLNSTATKILLRQNNNEKKAVGVQFIYRDQTYTVRVRREVVMGAGALNTPQILLLSGIGPQEELEKVGISQVHDLPGVGRNLQNHVAFYIGTKLHKHPSVNDLDWATALDYILYKSGPMSSTGLSQVTARINSPYADPSGKDPDLQIFFGGFVAHCAATGSVGDPEDPEHPDDKKKFTFSPVTLHPKSKGYVGLHTNNPLDPPKMVANYLTEQADVQVLVAGIRIIQQLANSTTMQQKYGMAFEKEEYGDCAEHHGYDTDAFWECAVKYYTGPENHQACSCKMGPKSDPLAVVDNKLVIHGLSNIRIVDASAMPLLVSGNTHATIVMMAERAVDFIKEKWLNKNTIENRFGTENVFPQRSPAITSPTDRLSQYINYKVPSQNNNGFYEQNSHLPNPYLGYNGKYNDFSGYYHQYNFPKSSPESEEHYNYHTDNDDGSYYNIKSY